MKYAHVAAYVLETPWAMLRSKLDEIEGILEFHMNGGSFTAEELKARIGDPSRPEPARRGAVAVLPLKGVISHRMGGMTEMSGGMSTEKFAGMFRQAMADDSVSAILLDVDSPGGTVTGVTELAAEIFAARGKKPITAHVNALGASAAYWIASAADSVIATPSGMVGSIGVITSHLDTSKADEREGVTRTVISAGKFKAEGHGPLSDEAKAAVQARVDGAYTMMTQDIAKARGVKASDIRNGYGEGRVLSAKDALAAGLIDGIATAEETLAKMLGGRAVAGMRAEGVSEELQAAIDKHGLVMPSIEAEADLRRRLERY